MVKEKINRKIKRNRGKVIIIDAPLLIEAKIGVDKLVVVKANVKLQIKRLGKRFKRNDILKRIRAQMPLRKKLSHADYIIDNSRSIKDTEKQVRKIWNKIEEEWI